MDSSYLGRLHPKTAIYEEYQLLAHGRWFSPGTPASSTTKTGRHDIAEILLKVALSTKINQSTYYCYVDVDVVVHFCIFLSGRESLECLYFRWRSKIGEEVCDPVIWLNLSTFWWPESTLISFYNRHSCLCTVTWDER